MKQLVYLAFGAILLMGCEGKEGPEGPAGPQGAQGEKGEAADFTIWNVTVPASSWQESGTAGQPGYMYYADYTITDPFTQDEFDNMAITVYVVESGVLIPLPFTYNNFGYETHLSYLISRSEFTFTTYDSDNYAAAPTGDLSYRIMIMQAGTPKIELDKAAEQYWGMEVKSIENN